MSNIYDIKCQILNVNCLVSNVNNVKSPISQTVIWKITYRIKCLFLLLKGLGGSDNHVLRYPDRQRKQRRKKWKCCASLVQLFCSDHFFTYPTFSLSPLIHSDAFSLSNFFIRPTISFSQFITQINFSPSQSPSPSSSPSPSQDYILII